VRHYFGERIFTDACDVHATQCACVWCRGHALLVYLDVEAGRLLRPTFSPVPDRVAPNTPREASLDPVGHLGRLFSRGVSVLSAALQPEFAPNAAAAVVGAADAEKEAAAAAAAKFWEELRGICWCPVRLAGCTIRRCCLPAHLLYCKIRSVPTHVASSPVKAGKRLGTLINHQAQSAAANHHKSLRRCLPSRRRLVCRGRQAHSSGWRRRERCGRSRMRLWRRRLCAFCTACAGETGTPTSS
jgi:hypothetical protein